MQFLRGVGTIDAAMKLVFFLTLAFFSGIEGFGLFAAYVAFVLSVHMLITKLRDRAEGPIARETPSDEALLLADVR